MLVYRITTRKWMKTASGGEGSRLFGGRWTSPGRPAVYTASSISLAILETLVHMDSRTAPPMVVFEVVLPDSVDVTVVSAADLPTNWNDPGGADQQAFGDAWLTEADTVALIVPSAVVPYENNVILNPLHAEFERVSVRQPEVLALDKRLLGG